MVDQSLVEVDAASENDQNNRGLTEGTQGKSKTMEGSWVQMSDKREFQRKNGKAEVRGRKT